MFFAFPADLKGGKVNDLKGKSIKFGQELSQPQKVDAFAGAAFNEETWTEKILTDFLLVFPDIDCDTYTSDYLLSDHSPVAFTYTDAAESTYRFLFANTGSLLGKRGIQDNKAAFGDNITLDDLKKWSNELVEPQIEGMIKLITSHQKVLEDAKTWKQYEDVEKGRPVQKGFEMIIKNYYKNVKHTPAVRAGKDEPRYKVLKDLSNQVWFRDLRKSGGFKPSEEAVKAKDKFKREDKDTWLVRPQTPCYGWHTPEDFPSAPVDKNGSRAVPKYSNGEYLTCCVCGEMPSMGKRHHCRCCGALTCGNADCSENKFMKIGVNGPQRFCKPCKVKFPRCKNCKGKGTTGRMLGKTVCKSCNGSGQDGAVNAAASHILSAFQKRSTSNISEEKSEEPDPFAACPITNAPVQVGQIRRRMAQREFSDRRDSPVMIRLLEEIMDAQDN